MSEVELELELEIGPEQFVDYERVVGRVDEQVERISADEAANLQCARGCSQCCVGGLELLPVEYFRIVMHLVENGIEPTPRGGEACLFLDDEGACGIYEVRPLVCRTQGMALRYREMPESTGLRRLPIVDGHEAGSLVTACELNFAEALPERANIIADETVQSMLHVVDRRFRELSGFPDAVERLPMDGLADPDGF